MAVQHKLVLAILQESDYESTLAELSQRRIFVTRLSSTGGFFKKKNVTVLIGVEEDRLDEVLKVLKVCAGRRKAQVSLVPDVQFGPEPTLPVSTDVGGVTVFVLNMDQLDKF